MGIDIPPTGKESLEDPLKGWKNINGMPHCSRCADIVLDSASKKGILKDLDVSSLDDPVSEARHAYEGQLLNCSMVDCNRSALLPPAQLESNE